MKYGKIATKNKNNNYSVRNINFSPYFNRKNTIFLLTKTITKQRKTY